MPDLLMSIDQGTTSTRAIVFDGAGRRVATGQMSHSQHAPAPGWAEQDIHEIWGNCREVVGRALGQAGLTRHDIAAVGITNQRETTAVWNRRTGRAVHPAIVWHDVRTEPIIARLRLTHGDEFFASRTGLPLSAYFSASKLVWILENIPGARTAAEAGELMFGTIDTWLIWNLTGGTAGGVHATDVTNASRTALMNLQGRHWDADILTALNIPPSLLPEIRASVDDFGAVDGRSLLRGTAITAVLGDQQAALFAHGISEPGQAKCTYGTGAFVMLHTGSSPIPSGGALIPTVAFQQRGTPPTYAVEGSIAMAGSLLQWFRDGLGILEDVAESEQVARSVADAAGVYVVPAFSGLYAPHWRPDARGTIVGVTASAGRRHFVRAGLDAIALQVADVLEAAQRESGLTLRMLRADGGASANGLLMQIQSDLLGVPVQRPKMTEMTALGVALAAGIGAGRWRDRSEIAAPDGENDAWSPDRDDAWRTAFRAGWTRAVDRSLGWAQDSVA